jgi:hypothetical protein
MAMPPIRGIAREMHFALVGTVYGAQFDGQFDHRGIEKKAMTKDDNSKSANNTR